MNSKKIAIFGCKSTTKFVLNELNAIHRISYLITIDEQLGEKNAVADYISLREYASSVGIEVYEARSYALADPIDQETINGFRIDVAFVIGWQRLIPQTIIENFTVGAFGMHGSSMDLPKGRGRSPMNWSILEGRSVFYTNLFRYDAGVDSGDIVDTLKFQITYRDTAETMHFKNTLAMKELINNNIDRLLANDFTAKRQSLVISPSYYPKRSPADSLIDWEQDVHSIERFVRAVTKPFNGAYSFIDNKKKIVIFDSQVFDLNEFGYEAAPVGSVVSVFENGKFLVKCYGGLLLVNDYLSDEVPENGCVLGNGGNKIKYFQRNLHGNYDLPKS